METLDIQKMMPVLKQMHEHFTALNKKMEAVIALETQMLSSFQALVIATEDAMPGPAFDMTREVMGHFDRAINAIKEA